MKLGLCKKKYSVQITVIRDTNRHGNDNNLIRVGYITGPLPIHTTKLPGTSKIDRSRSSSSAPAEGCCHRFALPPPPLSSPMIPAAYDEPGVLLPHPNLALAFCRLCISARACRRRGNWPAGRKKRAVVALGPTGSGAVSKNNEK
jgi:hypothetical protein